MNQPLETTEQLSADERRRLLAEMLQKKANRAGRASPFARARAPLADGAPGPGQLPV